MVLTVNDWFPKAPVDAQLHWNKLSKLYCQVLDLKEEILKLDAPFFEEAQQLRSRLGPGFVQIADQTIDLEIYPKAVAAWGTKRELYESTRRELADAFVTGAEKYNMGVLGIFERQYEILVGTPLPR
ncbi:MAG: hypothetical protein Q7K43_00395 [Candidatus Woesearchaeota archaeon]|nr:hypothetical protein [Candidatus Woesearchaeota archaeon]